MNFSLRTWPLAIAAMFAMTLLANRSAASAEFREFLTKHCVDCHGADVQEAQLRLDSLTEEFSDPQAMATWVKLFDKVRKGEMPPESADQPSAAERDKMLASLQKELHAASLAHQKERGRVQMRRLNRVEYENTLADLVGLRVAVKDLLPEDGAADGFDNVAVALDISPAHMPRYLAAADKALTLAMTRSQSGAVNQRWLAGPWIEERKKDSIGKSYVVDGDAAILFTSQKHGFQGQRISVPGRYRFRFACTAVNTTEPIALYASWYKTFNDGPPVCHYFMAPPGKTVVHEWVLDHQTDGSISVTVPSLPSSEDLTKARGEKSLEEFKAPGVRVEWLELVGPEGRQWPPESHRALFGDLVPFYPISAIQNLQRNRPLGDLEKTPPTSPWQAYSSEPAKDIPAVLLRFASRAFRRPVKSDEVAPFVAMAQERLAAGYEFNDAMRVAFKAILCDVRFLYFIEQPGKLDDYAVASRLSYFLWSTMPDEQLLAAAAEGKLRDPATLRAQTERLLQDPRAEQFRENFLGQWMRLRKLRDTFPDQSLYPEYDEPLHWAMEQETNLFFAEILQNDLSLLNFVDSDFLFLNERLAIHYRIDGVKGDWMRKVANPPNSHRGGLLTQAAVMKVSADGTVTSPILRGKFVLEQILGTPPSPPPPGIAAIEPDIRGATNIREQLAKHKSTAACASCHRHLDPPGFALECFDVIGGYRTYYRASIDRKLGREALPLRGKVWVGPPVELGDVTPEGERFTSIEDYKQILLRQKDQLARSLAEKLLVYSTGGGLEFADRQEVEEMVADVRTKNYGFRDLIHSVVQNRVFLSK